MPTEPPSVYRPQAGESSSAPPSPQSGPVSTLPPGQTLALFAGLLTVVVWGVNFAVQKALFEVLPPAAFLWARYALMPVCAVLLLLHVNRWRWLRLPRADALQLVRLGILGHTVHVGMVTFGIHWSTAFSSALILSCGPVYTLLILHWVGHERLTRGQVGGVSLACAGVAVFLSDKLIGAQWAATGGDLVLLAAASVFSYYTVMSRPLIARHGGAAVMAYATLAGSPALLLLCLPAAWAAPWPAMDALHWGLLLWASFVSAFLGWLVWGWVNNRRGVGRTAPLQYLMPLVAGVVAWWATGERFGTVKLLGAAVTLAGVAWAQYAARPAGATAAGAEGDAGPR